MENKALVNKFIKTHKNIILAEQKKIRSRSASKPILKNEKLNYGSAPELSKSISISSTCGPLVLSPPIKPGPRNCRTSRTKQGPCRSQLPPKPISKQTEESLSTKPNFDCSQRYFRLPYSCIDNTRLHNQNISKIPIKLGQRPIYTKRTLQNQNFSASTFKIDEGCKTNYESSALLFAEITAIKSSLKRVSNCKFTRRSADQANEDEKSNISIAELLNLTLEKQRCSGNSEVADDVY